MGTKLQVDSNLPEYFSSRNLNHDFDTMSWATFHGEGHLSNGQHYCSSLLRAPSDSLPGGDTDSLKQTILKHESIFKNQVIELHRLYRVQKNLTDGILREEQYSKDRVLYEASSSSSIFRSELITDDAQGRNSSRFLFTNSICDGPPVSVQGIIQPSDGNNNHKGKSIQGSSSPLQKLGSFKGSNVSDSRPTKVRRMIDLELPGDEYIDLDDSEERLCPIRRVNTMYQKDASRCELSLRKPNLLVDLNEPLQSEETNPSVKYVGLPSQDHLTTDPGLPKDFPCNSIRGNMIGTPKKYSNGNHWLFLALKKDANKESGFSSPVSHQPASVSPIHSPAKQNAGLTTFEKTLAFSGYSCLSQNSSSLHASPYLNSTCLGKSPQSSARSNEFLGNGWHPNSKQHRSSSGFKELPAYSSYSDKANSFDLNCTGDFNLNVAPPNCSSSEPDSEVVKVLDHQNSAVSSRDFNHPSSRKKILGEDEIDGGRRKALFDINLPCDESEDFDDSTTSEAVVIKHKTETGRSNGLPNIIDFDLNSYAMEEEIPAADLEAPVDPETEEDSSDDATVAAEAILAISSYAAKKDVKDTLVSPPEDALSWFVDIVCSSPNNIRSSQDYFEEMTLKLTECKAEEYFPSPPVFDFPSVEETVPANVRGRTRTRRGRQRRDFQRDILPGLISLARNEVTEDIQTFGGLMRATGHAWPCGTRKNARNGNKRGRKRKPVVVPPPPPLESARLRSWGKTTRRPRRQRYSTAAVAGNPAPIALT